MSGIIDHPSFEQPKDDLILWRYMDLPFFIFLLKESKLYLTRLDQLEDPYEGRVGKFDVSEKMKKSFEFAMHEAGIFTRETPREEKDRHFTMLDNSISMIPRYHYVSCWHANNNESVAMWKIYSKSNHSIALKTKYSQLVDVISDKCYLGQVKYFDYDKEYVHWGNAFNLVMSKRKEFEYEKEVRVVSLDTCDSKCSVLGLLESIDLNKLIDEILICPNAEEWFVPLVNDLVNKYGYSFNIRKSSLYDNHNHKFKI